MIAFQAICCPFESDCPLQFLDFHTMSIDEVNEKLRLGLISIESAQKFVDKWNENPNRFHFARIFGGKILLLDFPTPNLDELE